MYPDQPPSPPVTTSSPTDPELVYDSQVKILQNGRFGFPYSINVVQWILLGVLFKVEDFESKDFRNKFLFAWTKVSEDQRDYIHLT